jgi:hypothetical protein
VLKRTAMANDMAVPVRLLSRYRAIRARVFRGFKSRQSFMRFGAAPENSFVDLSTPGSTKARHCGKRRVSEFLFAPSFDTFGKRHAF